MMSAIQRGLLAFSCGSSCSCTSVVAAAVTCGQRRPSSAFSQSTRSKSGKLIHDGRSLVFRTCGH